MSKHRSAGPLRRFLGLALLLACFSVALTPTPGPAVRKAIRTTFGGVGAWVDIFDDQGWADPEGTVLALQQYGVRTLYLQTCNYQCKADIHRPTTLSRWLESAHAAGIRVVAWYLPGLEDMELDTRRTLAALQFRSAGGHAFDGFALDIEARIVNPVAKRNRLILELSRTIRQAAGARYPLGAITIPWFYDWGGPFPYAGLNEIYDAFLPMIYFGGRGEGPKTARINTARNIQQIRAGTGNLKTPVHAIGGIADDLNEREVGSFVRTAQRRHALGVSLYDFFTSDAEDWGRLALWTDSAA
jgi:hypothetical protein